MRTRLKNIESPDIALHNGAVKISDSNHISAAPLSSFDRFNFEYSRLFSGRRTNQSGTYLDAFDPAGSSFVLIKQTGLSFEEYINGFVLNLTSQQTDIDLQTKSFISENLWDLYD